MATIQERIAALNQAHVGRGPVPSPPHEIRPDLPGSRPSMSGRYVAPANESRAPPVPVRDQEILPPPSITRTGQKSSTTTTKPRKPPPPLPTRKVTGEPSPALPPRKSTDTHTRRNSGDSSLSAASISTRATTSSSGNGKSPSITCTSTESSTTRKLAPAWGETALPPLPPKRNTNTDGNPTLKSRSSLGVLDSSCKTSSSSLSSLTPKLPLRSHSSNTNDLPAIPPRKFEIKDLDAPPQLPQRKLPPPAPSFKAIEKIRESSFSTLKNASIHHGLVPNGDTHGQKASGSPPPIPLGSRPDLSKIQATKPRMPSCSSPPSTGPTTVCMICRDFSGPDSHAARFPRQSLPTQDLSWLANQLTAPFSSLTDKARAIFTWLHHNIDYNVDEFFNNKLKSSTPESTLTTGLAVCEGYAGLFERLATLAGLEARVITGHGKGYGYTPLAPGSPKPPYDGNHAWNVVRIDNGQWKLIDSCWGAGNVSGKGQPYNREFTPEYFTMSNDEFGNKHFPANPGDFYRDDGRPSISWEEYISINPSCPNGVEPPILYTGIKQEHGIGERSLQPRSRKIAVHQPGPIRFQFGLICEHWTLARSNIRAPCLFILFANGVDGGGKEYIPFHYVRGSDPGGGDHWYVDVPDPRVLGAPGQKLHIYSVTSFGDLKDTRGLSREEFLRGVGRKAMGFGGIAEWELV
ncbi:kyphoscoliosis peptidase [Histoplasma ohiense]|nr:kyphoscoliosis peptidase [Histoplasma ohiense (nom. inval.)]